MVIIQIEFLIKPLLASLKNMYRINGINKQIPIVVNTLKDHRSYALAENYL